MTEEICPKCGAKIFHGAEEVFCERSGVPTRMCDGKNRMAYPT